ncbi:MAG: radical SAM family heme chaperone HemW [Bacteroidetes bacterium]|nr:radical SAM family heme chaperone HemW [Bacteroidota bacterium]
MAGIYIHIPFCRQACNYCDFHFSTVLNNKAEVIEAICKEVHLRKDYLEDKTLNSIYFGGGTPSLLSAQELENMMNALKKEFAFSDTIEITLEANPDDINAQKLKEWQQQGINRLSIGLQSFNDEELKWMNRTHTAAESLFSVKLAQDKGFSSITIDLIYGSKFQTLSSWEDTLQQAVDLKTKHISSYNLTIENKTLLGTRHLKGSEPPVNDELSSKQFLLMIDLLENTGYTQYEISNFGLPGYYAVHNSNYWLGHHYLGLGPSAHSFNGISRQWNVKNNNVYTAKLLSGKPFFELENLSVNDRYNEYILTGLRTIWGCNISEIERLFGSQITAHFRKIVHLKKDMITEKNGVYTLSKAGKLLADGLAADLFIR